MLYFIYFFIYGVQFSLRYLNLDNVPKLNKRVRYDKGNYKNVVKTQGIRSWEKSAKKKNKKKKKKETMKKQETKFKKNKRKKDKTKPK